MKCKSGKDENEMIEAIINKSVRFLVDRKTISNTPEQLEIYRYGLELWIYYIVNATILLAISVPMGRVWEVALFLFLFALVQTNGGGYHADTHGKCLAFMVAGVLVFIALLSLFQASCVIQIIGALFGLCIICFLAPVSHVNHSLSRDYSKRLGNRAKRISFALIGICIALLVLDMMKISAVLSLALFFSGVSLICAFLKAKNNEVHCDKKLFDE